MVGSRRSQTGSQSILHRTESGTRHPTDAGPSRFDRLHRRRYHSISRCRCETIDIIQLTRFDDLIINGMTLAKCNESMGFSPCLMGGCYHLKQRCNGISDCADDSDEDDCKCNSLPYLRQFNYSFTNNY